MRYFGHTRPVRDGSTGEIIDSTPAPVKARTRAMLGHGYGPDSDKRLIVSCEAGDIIALRPERTGRTLVIEARDLYALLIRKLANLQQLQKARERKAAKELKRRFK